MVQQSPSTAPATDDPPPSDTPPSAPPREAAGTTQSPKGVAGAAGAASPRTPRPQTSPKGGVKGVGATVLPGGFTVAQLQSGMRVAGPLGLLQPGGGGRAVQVGSRVGAGAAGKAGGVAFMQPMSTMLTAAAGGASKPVAFSLVQSADGSLHAAAAPAGVQPRTVLLTTAKADGQKIIATMQPGAMRAAGGPAVRFGRPAGVPVVTASPRAGAARFVQHVPAASPLQTVGAKLAGVTAQKQVATTIKIQGEQRPVIASMYDPWSKLLYNFMIFSRMTFSWNYAINFDHDSTSGVQPRSQKHEPSHHNRHDFSHGDPCKIEGVGLLGSEGNIATCFPTEKWVIEWESLKKISLAEIIGVMVCGRWYDGASNARQSGGGGEAGRLPTDAVCREGPRLGRHPYCGGSRHLGRGKDNRPGRQG